MERLQDEQKLRMLSKPGNDPFRNIMDPEYELDKRINVYRELNQPPASLFIGIGYDVPNPDGSAIEDPKKHYRRYYQDELENNKNIF